ncbi:MAG: glutaredoxin domain-containing protein [Gammaproteobacteria bacterium]
MKNQLKMPAILILGLGFGPASAVTVYECIDAAGDRVFQQSCPPGTTQAGEKSIYTGSRENGGNIDIEQLSEEHPITFYTSNNCEACEIMRVYLVARDVPFSQKNVAEDVALQEELIQTSGELAVPFVTIGEQSISGYDMAQLRSTLDSVGYPDKSAGNKTEE